MSKTVNFKRFSSAESEYTQEPCQWRDTPHSTKLYHYWSLTIKLNLTPQQRCSRCILQTQPTGPSIHRGKPEEKLLESIELCLTWPKYCKTHSRSRIKRSRSNQVGNNHFYKMSNLGEKKETWGAVCIIAVNLHLSYSFHVFFSWLIIYLSYSTSKSSRLGL